MECTLEPVFIFKVQIKIYLLFIQDFDENEYCNANDDGDAFYFDEIIRLFKQLKFIV